MFKGGWPARLALVVVPVLGAFAIGHWMLGFGAKEDAEAVVSVPRQAPADPAMPLTDDDTGMVELDDLPGLENFGRVTRWLYRGADPTPEGMLALKRMGVRTVISLRRGDDAENRLTARSAGLDYVQIPADALNPDDQAVITFLRLVADRNRGPFFIYCWTGNDRTGFMAAMYRIVFCGWGKDEAMAEMTNRHYNSFLNWQEPFIIKLDVEALKRKAAIPPQVTRGG